MSSVNNTNGPVDFWANLKKQKEEEARQREQADHHKNEHNVKRGFENAVKIHLLVLLPFK